MRIRLGQLKRLVKESAANEPVLAMIVAACGPGEARASRRDKIIRTIETNAGVALQDLRAACQRLAIGPDGSTAAVAGAYDDAMALVPDHRKLESDLIGKFGSLQ